VLAAKNYEVFLPTRRQAKQRPVNQSPERRKALFPGYLFCKITDRGVGKILTTPGVIRIVGIGNRPTPVPDEELESIRTAVESGINAQTWRYLPHGSKVRISNGPLEGLSGVLVSEPSGRRLVVSVTLLQRSVAITLDNDTELAINDRQPQPAFSSSVSSRYP